MHAKFSRVLGFQGSGLVTLGCLGIVVLVLIGEPSEKAPLFRRRLSRFAKAVDLLLSLDDFGSDIVYELREFVSNVII
jgi:hypothetical protein